MEKSFSDLLQVHRILDGLFREHQRALLLRELESASALLDEYETELLAHMRDEEQHLIPIYASRAEHALGGAPAIFLNEHDKLRQYVTLFKLEMPKLELARDLESKVIWLLDSQTTFKRLLLHHDARESKMLYPSLDQATSAAERDSLFAVLELSPYSNGNRDVVWARGCDTASPRRIN